MYHDEWIKVVSTVCIFYTICVYGENVHPKQPHSVDNGFSVHSLPAETQSGDLFALLWKLHKRNTLVYKQYDNVTLNGGNKVILPVNLEQSLDIARCIDLFKRKHSHYLLKKYWMFLEKQIRPHWLHKCLNYLADFSEQKAARQLKSVHKREADSNQMSNNPNVNNINDKENTQFVKMSTASPARNTTYKFRPYYVQNNNTANDSSGSSTAPWVFITIGVALVFLVIVITALACMYRRRRKGVSYGNSQDEYGCNFLVPLSEVDSTKEIKSAISSSPDPLDQTDWDNIYYESCSVATRDIPSPDELYLNIEPSTMSRKKSVNIYSLGDRLGSMVDRSCEPTYNTQHSILSSCLSPCVTVDTVDRPMPPLGFINSQRDDGNKLRGGNGDFQRRYVDVDYVHNDIDLRPKRHNLCSSGLEQDFFPKDSRNITSDPRILDQEQRWKASMNRSSREGGRNGSNTSSSARSYISIPPTSPSENYIEAGSDDTSVRSTPPTKMAWLTKNLKVDVKNEIRNYQASLGTQTESDQDITAPMCKTVFGTPWQFGGTFTSRGGVLQAKDSDVCLVLTANAVSKGEYIDIYGAVCTDTTEIRKKLNFPARESLITPVIEYHAVPVNHFNTSVCVRLPHAMPEEFDSSLIRVYTFSVDERGKVSMNTVPLYSKARNDKSDGALYWEKGSDGCTIHIYTTHFSGYFCTLCETSSLPSICTMVFGSHVQITQSRREIRVILYIWDRRLTIKDYLERFRKQESDVDRQLLTDMQVPLLDDASSDSRLVMKMEVMGEDEDRKSWKHVSRPDGSRPLFKSLQVRKLSEIVHCCRQTDPIRVEWALENAPHRIPSAIFQCCIDMMHVHESTRDYETAMREGSDDLMRTFYVRDLKVVTHSSQELKPNRTVQLVDLKRALLDISDIVQTEKMCQEFGITIKDIGNFKKKYPTVQECQAGLVEECLRRHGFDKFMNQLPHILERLQLSHILNALESRKILLREFTDLPGHSDTVAQSKTVAHVKKQSQSLGSDRDSTRCKSPYRRSSPHQRNRSSSPTNRRRSKDDSKGNHRPDLHQQMSEKSDDVFFINTPPHHPSGGIDHYKRNVCSDRESRQSQRHGRSRHNSPPSEHSVGDEVNMGSQSLGYNKVRYAGQNTEERQPLKNQRSSSSRADSVLSSSSIPPTDNFGASSYFPSRSTADPSMITHADPKDFAEPYSDEFLDDQLQQTYKKERAVQMNLSSPHSIDNAPCDNIRGRLQFSESGPQALPPESRQTNHSSFSDPVPPYQKLSNDQRSREKSRSQDEDQTNKKELFGTHTAV